MSGMGERPPSYLSCASLAREDADAVFIVLRSFRCRKASQTAVRSSDSR